MRRAPLLSLLFLAALGALAGAGQALAHGGAGRDYEFVGTVNGVDTATNHIAVNVTGGNRAALRAMIGQPASESFLVDANTRYVTWSGGAPSPSGLLGVQAGERVRVLVRAPRNSPLSTLLATPARRVAVRIAPLPHRGPAWVFVGTCSSVGPSNIALTVTGGNWLALWKMLGQPVAQTFAFDAQRTIFVSWTRGVPTVVPSSQAAQLCGQRPGNVVVTVFAPRDATLAQAETTPAVRVGFHSPGAGQHQ